MSITGFQGHRQLERRPPGKHHSFRTLAVRPCCAPVRAGGCQGLWRAVRRLKHPTCLVRNVYQRLSGPPPACLPPAGQAPQFPHLSRAPLLCTWIFGAKIFRGTKVPVPFGQSTGNLQYSTTALVPKFTAGYARLQQCWLRLRSLWCVHDMSWRSGGSGARSNARAIAGEEQKIRGNEVSVNSGGTRMRGAVDLHIRD